MSSQRDSSPDDGDVDMRSENTNSDLHQSSEPEFGDRISPFPSSKFPIGMGTANNSPPFPDPVDFPPNAISNQEQVTAQVSDHTYILPDGSDEDISDIDFNEIFDFAFSAGHSSTHGVSNSTMASEGVESTETGYSHPLNKPENDITQPVTGKGLDFFHKWEDCLIDKSSPFLVNKASLESARGLDSFGSLKIATLRVPRSGPDLFYSGAGKSWDVGSALVLVGDSQDARATTCLEYVRSIWKIEGQHLIKGFLSVCKQKGDVMGDYLGMQWRIHDDDDKDFIPVTFGPLHIRHERYLYRLVTLFTWLVSVFPHSQPSNLELNGPHKCDVSIICKQEPATSHDELTFQIQEGILAPIPESHGSCWHPLFKGGAIAYEYPIPQRGGEIGVEIPFEAMVQLGRVSYTLELPTGGTILKGHSTMLIPTNGASQDSVQWHFIGSNQPGEHISADRIPQELKEQVLDLDIEALAKRKAYLGYCRTAYMQIGTKQSRFEHATKSHVGCAKSTWRIGREISASVGSEGTGIFGGSIATKLILTKPLYAQILEEETCLMDRLLNSKSKATLLYDPEKKTGFLVPEINVVLQIVHIWASQQPDSEHLLAKMPFVPPGAEEGQAACDIIMLNRDLLLREGYADEKKLFFMSKLKNVFLSLEKRREQQRLVQETSFSIGLSNYIRGWELFDIATCQPSQEKRLDLPLKHGACWTKIPRHHPDILVLFYKGLADPIIPASNDVCRTWDPLPQEYYLMASVSCVKSLSEKIGGGSCQLRLTESLYLQAPEKGKTFWSCYDCENGGCSHVQILGPKPSLCQAPLQRGAILFGKRVVRKPIHHISLTQ